MGEIPTIWECDACTRKSATDAFAPCAVPSFNKPDRCPFSEDDLPGWKLVDWQPRPEVEKP